MPWQHSLLLSVSKFINRYPKMISPNQLFKACIFSIYSFVWYVCWYYCCNSTHMFVYFFTSSNGTRKSLFLMTAGIKRKTYIFTMKYLQPIHCMWICWSKLMGGLLTGRTSFTRCNQVIVEWPLFPLPELVTAQQCGGGEDAVNQRIQKLVEEWTFLTEKSGEKSDKLKEANRQRMYTAAVKDLEFWLGEVGCQKPVCNKMFNLEMKIIAHRINHCIFLA